MSQYVTFSIKVSIPCPSIIIIFAEMLQHAPALLTSSRVIKEEPKTPGRVAGKGRKRKAIFLEIIKSGSESSEDDHTPASPPRPIKKEPGSEGDGDGGSKEIREGGGGTLAPKPGPGVPEVGGDTGAGDRTVVGPVVEQDGGARIGEGRLEKDDRNGVVGAGKRGSREGGLETDDGEGGFEGGVLGDTGGGEMKAGSGVPEVGGDTGAGDRTDVGPVVEQDGGARIGEGRLEKDDRKGVVGARKRGSREGCLETDDGEGGVLGDTGGGEMKAGLVVGCEVDVYSGEGGLPVGSEVEVASGEAGLGARSGEVAMDVGKSMVEGDIIADDAVELMMLDESNTLELGEYIF